MTSKVLGFAWKVCSHVRRLWSCTMSLECRLLGTSEHIVHYQKIGTQMKWELL